MVRKKTKNRYIPPEIRQAKELADQYGRAYYEAMWLGPKLRARRFMIESASQFTGYDCTKDLQELDGQIVLADNNLPLARDRLREARAQLALLRYSHT